MHMDSKIQILEEQYWAGETSPEEEAILKRAASLDNPGMSDALKSLFETTNLMATNSLKSDFEDNFWKKVESETEYKGKVVSFNASSFLKYAAVGIVAVAFSFAIGNLIFKFNAQPESTTPAYATLADTYDSPEQAYLEMKRALMFASDKLNKGQGPVNELKKFDDGMNAIQTLN